jgi:hypothetical protein
MRVWTNFTWLRKEFLACKRSFLIRWATIRLSRRPLLHKVSNFVAFVHIYATAKTDKITTNVTTSQKHMLELAFISCTHYSAMYTHWRHSKQKTSGRVPGYLCRYARNTSTVFKQATTNTLNFLSVIPRGSIPFSWYYNMQFRLSMSVHCNITSESVNPACLLKTCLLQF